jgi:hypothetical protein
MWWSRPLTNGRGLVIGGLLVLFLLDVGNYMRTLRRFVVAYEEKMELLVYLSTRSVFRALGDLFVGGRVLRGSR